MPYYTTIDGRRAYYDYGLKYSTEPPKLKRAKAFVCIDYHGVLVNKQEQVPKKYKKIIQQLLKKLKTKGFLIGSCTGNDLGFVRKVLKSNGLLNLYDFHVLETGCALGYGNTEHILVKNYGDRLKKLREILQKDFQHDKDGIWGRYFWEERPRHATKCLFVKRRYADNNKALGRFADYVSSVLKKHALGRHFYTTYSNVAVDIIPKGHTKFTGLKKIAGDIRTIIIADGLNDIDAIDNVDIAIAPGNYNKKIHAHLKKRTAAAPLGHKKNLQKTLLITKHQKTRGLIEALEFIISIYTQPI